ncbi:MAG: flagellin [Armatimonadota bacterium]|nr:hypothetical protein [bacterium]
MSLKINLNTTALTAQRMLSSTDSKLSKSIERLSSGFRINTAADDPAGLVISEKLQAQVNGLSQAISNASDAVNMVKTSEGALTEVSSLLSSMRDLAVHAANAGANDDAAVAADQQQIVNAIESINNIAKETQFGNKNLLDGSAGVKTAIVGTGVTGANLNNGGMNLNSVTRAASGTTMALYDFAADTTAMGGAGTIVVTGALGSFSYSYTAATTVSALAAAIDAQAATTGVSATTDGNGLITLASNDGTNDLVGSAALVSISDSAGYVLTGSASGAASQTSRGLNELEDSDSVSIEITQAAEQATLSSKTFASSTTAIGDDGYIELTGPTGTTVTIDYTSDMTASGFVDAINAVTDSTGVTATYNTTTNTIVFNTEDYGSDVSLTIADSGNNILASGQTSASDSGVDVHAIVKNANGELASDVEWTSGAGTVLKDTHSNVIYLTTTAATTIADLGEQFSAEQNSLEFQIGAYSGQTRQVSIGTCKCEGLGLGASSLYTSLSDIDVTTAEGAQEAIKVLDQAISDISTLRANLGATQTNVLESSISSLTVAEENISASQSTIKDTDMAEEITTMTKYQILEQAGVAMLSQANQIPQNLLSLLQ